MTEQDFEKMEELTRKVTRFLGKQHRIYTDVSIYPSHVGLRLSFIRTFNGIGNAEALSDILGFTERYHPSYRWFERLIPVLNEHNSKVAAGLQVEISKLARLQKKFAQCGARKLHDQIWVARTGLPAPSRKWR